MQLSFLSLHSLYMQTRLHCLLCIGHVNWLRMYSNSVYSSYIWTNFNYEIKIYYHFFKLYFFNLLFKFEIFLMFLKFWHHKTIKNIIYNIFYFKKQFDLIWLFLSSPFVMMMSLLFLRMRPWFLSFWTFFYFLLLLQLLSLL